MRFGPAILERAEALAAITERPGMLARSYLTPQHRQAGERIRGWMREAGMQALNQAYRDKFGFPFIVAVKGLDWAGIIERIEARLGNDAEAERATALAQIGRIARFRLEALS